MFKHSQNTHLPQLNPRHFYKEFRLEEQDFEFLEIRGGFQRAECILSDKQENLFAAFAPNKEDEKGGVIRFNLTTREHQFIGSTPEYINNRPEGYQVDQPNGLAWYDEKHILIANFGLGILEILDITTGERRLLLDKYDGKPLGHANFVLLDAQGRIYLTISTTDADWSEAINPKTHNGYILLITGDIIHGEYKIEKVASDIYFANEAHFSPDGKELIVAETCACRLSCYDINEDGTLGSKKNFGPDDLNGLPDGFAIDEKGNALVTLVHSDRIVVVTPGCKDIITIFKGGDTFEHEKIMRIFLAYDENDSSSQKKILDVLGNVGWQKTRAITSINFIPDPANEGRLTTAVLGSLMSPVIPYITKKFPVPALKPRWPISPDSEQEFTHNKKSFYNAKL